MQAQWIEGKTVLITGGSSGIGFATARALAGMGAIVAIASRNEARTREAARRISAATAWPVQAFTVDLSSQDSIRDFVRGFKRWSSRLDVLVNNAGAMFMRRQQSADGIEKTWALNHLGPFLLTAELMPLMKNAVAARVITVASEAHRGGRLDLDDPEFRTRRFEVYGAYAQSKLANIMFTYALARRLGETSITANCLHPGVVASGFFRPVPVVGPLLAVLGRPLMVSEAEGARTPVHLAASGEVAGLSGGYYSKCALARSNTASHDVAAQERLWALSLAATGARAFA